MVDDLQGSFKTSQLQADQHREAEGDGIRRDTARHSSGYSTDRWLQQCKEPSASCSAKKSPPRARNRNQKAKFLLFHSDVGNLPSPSLLFKDLKPTSSQFCKG